MLTSITVATLVVLAATLIAGRRPFAHAQDLVIGARGGVGCVVAEAIAVLVLAIIILLLRPEA